MSAMNYVVSNSIAKFTGGNEPDGQILQGYFIPGVECQGGEKPVQLLHITYTIQTWKVTKENLVDDVSLYETRGIRLYCLREDHLGIPAETEEIQEVFVQRGYIAGLKKRSAVCLLLPDNTTHAEKLHVFVKSKGRQQEVREPACNRLTALQAQGSGCRAGYGYSQTVSQIHELFQVYLPVFEILGFIEENKDSFAKISP
jgi:hypothetical protein